MGQSLAVSGTSANRILAALPSDDFALVAARLEPFELVPRRVIYDPDGVIDYVYFPESGMVSRLGVLLDGTGVETSSTGREGMVGMPLFHGTDRWAEQVVVQLPGTALRMTAAAFRECVQRSTALHDVLHLYSACVYMLAAQSIACMSKHDTSRRLARWLLHAADQSGTEQLELTQLFLAQMLGVRRSSVTVAAGALRDKGLITYTRKHITFTDRAALERSTCECYRIIKSTYDRLLDGDGGGARVANPLAGLQTSRDGVSILEAPHGDGSGEKQDQEIRGDGKVR